MFVFAIIVGVIALVVVAIVISQHLEKKRMEAVQAAAQKMGLTFSPLGDPTLQGRLSALGLFGLGRDRRLTNLVFGETDECRISIFDYRYTTGSGKHQHTHKITVAALESPRLKNPVFSLRPEGLFDKIGGMLGFQDIDFPSHEDFSRKFVLKGPSEESIRKFFEKSLLDFLTAKSGISVEAVPGIMTYYIASQRRKPEDFPKLFEEAYQIFGAIVDR